MPPFAVVLPWLESAPKLGRVLAAVPPNNDVVVVGAPNIELLVLLVVVAVAAVVDAAVPPKIFVVGGLLSPKMPELTVRGFGSPKIGFFSPAPNKGFDSLKIFLAGGLKIEVEGGFVEAAVVELPPKPPNMPAVVGAVVVEDN